MTVRATVSLTEKELRALLHLVDTMKVEDAEGFGLDQLQISDLYLNLSDAFHVLEDIRLPGAK